MQPMHGKVSYLDCYECIQAFMRLWIYKLSSHALISFSFASKTSLVHSLPNSTKSFVSYRWISVKLDCHGIASAGYGRGCCCTTVFLAKWSILNTDTVISTWSMGLNGKFRECQLYLLAFSNRQIPGLNLKNNHKLWF